MTRHVLAAVAVSAVALSACSTELPPLGGDPAPSWDQIEVGLAIGCGGDTCHVRRADGSAGVGAEGLDLTPGRAYRHLLGDDCLGLESAQDFGARARPLLVARGDPDASYLVCKMDPACDRLAHGTVHMPPIGGTRDPTMLARVRAWIAAGALGPPDPEGDGCVGPPEFDGATDATRTAPDTVEVRWEAARDPRGDAFGVGYRVYAGTAPGAVDFLRPRIDRPPPRDPADASDPVRGATLSGLRQGWQYVFVVRAYSADGGEDANRVEVGAELTDVEAPTFAGILPDATTIGADGRIHVVWEPARDNVDPARLVEYLVLTSDRSRGWDPAMPALVTAPGALEAAIDPIPGAAMSFVAVRARDRAENTDTNAVEAVVRARNANAPSFDGVTSVSALPGALMVTWAAASDDETPVSDIDYLVHVATEPGRALEETPRVTRGATSAAIGLRAPSTTYFVVVRARDADGNTDGNTREMSATTPAAMDTTAPTFAGASGALGITRGVRLSWSAATDDTAAADAIQYLVWEAPSAGTEMLAGPPTYETALGATSFDVPRLTVGTPLGMPLFFVVRARDPAGNVDGNRIEVSAVPLPDATPPAFVGLESATAASASAVTLAWSAASDDSSPASAILYAVYMGTAPGAVSFASPVALTPAAATGATVTGLAPGSTYSFVVRARDEEENEDTNTTERSVALVDDTPPTFAGLASATATGTTSIDLAWAAAADDVTAPSEIEYLVYRATASGAQAFAMPTATTPPGATTFTVSGLDPGTRHFFVVRARDGAGNVDVNTREQSATTSTPTASFDSDVWPILEMECAFSGCHGSGAGALLLTPSLAYSAMVGVTSRNCPPTLLVEAGDPDGSFLYQKVTGIGICTGGGTLMPRGRPPLTAGEIETIRLWIALGALDD